MVRRAIQNISVLLSGSSYEEHISKIYIRTATVAFIDLAGVGRCNSALGTSDQGRLSVSSLYAKLGEVNHVFQLRT